MNRTNVCLELNLIEFQQGLFPGKYVQICFLNLSLVNLPRKTSNLNIEIDNEMPKLEDYGLKPERADCCCLMHLGTQSKRDAKVFLTLLLQILVMQLRPATCSSFQIFLPNNFIKDYKWNKN